MCLALTWVGLGAGAGSARDAACRSAIAPRPGSPMAGPRSPRAVATPAVAMASMPGVSRPCCSGSECWAMAKTDNRLWGIENDALARCSKAAAVIGKKYHSAPPILLLAWDNRK